MIDLKLDPVTWDLAIEGGDLAIVSGADELVQHIGIRLRTILGEWFQDPSIGFLDLKRMYGRPASEAHFRRRLIEEIEADDQVLKGSAVIDALTYERETRARSVSWHARMVSGDPLVGLVSVSP